MKNFSLEMRTKIYFGKNSIENLNNHIPDYNNILLVYGKGSIKKNGIYEDIYKILNKFKINVYELNNIKPNPEIIKVYEGIKICKENKIDLILAAGGGSVIDTAKAISAGVYYQDDIWELFLKDDKIEKSIDIGVILTLSATGSEANANSVIQNDKRKEKLAIHNDMIRPKFAILDPYYTLTVSKYQTACGVADIFAHILEQYFYPEKDAYIADRLAESLMRSVIKFGEILITDLNNIEARAEIMWASTLALIGILKAGKYGDWASHTLEHELSAYYDIAHGAGLAIIFPAWLKYVYSDDKGWKYREYGINVWGINPDLTDKEIAEKSIEKTINFFKKLELPVTLKEANIDDKYITEWAENIINRLPSKEIGNFKKLNKEDIINIYKLAL